MNPSDIFKSLIIDGWYKAFALLGGVGLAASFSGRILALANWTSASAYGDLLPSMAVLGVGMELAMVSISSS